MADKNNLPLLLCRPKEPCFMVKGEGEGVLFDVPTNFLTDRYKDMVDDIRARSGKSDRIPVSDKYPLPDLKDISKLGRERGFSVWMPLHKNYAGKLISIFMKAKSVDELQSAAVYTRDRVNPYLFNYCLSVALLHRPDTKNTNIPLFHETFPGKFMDSSTFVQLREETSVVPEVKRTPIVIPRENTANSKEPEHALWYFREDIGINLHHYHWHLVYPGSGDAEIVNKDRRGELFYYMHQQVIARYNFERLCNRLPRTVPFSDFRSVIDQGYFSKLNAQVASRGWPGRMSGTFLQDLDRDQDQLSMPISDMEGWRDAIILAIRQGSAMDESGKSIPLNNENGIDILGNMIESSDLSPNQTTYGGLHNVGHIFMSYIHDPDGRHLESFSVMADPSTAMRDVIFYRWHAFIDGLFNMHKETLRPYTTQQLTFTGVQVASIQVQTQTGQPNILQTFWKQADIDLATGLDFSARGNAFVRITHLMNDPFTYTIVVNNSTGTNRIGNIRIFMAPKFTVNGQRFSFREQRRMMVELDRFISGLAVGQNTITRKSTDSSVTIPYERTFRTARPNDGTDNSFDWCNCGWPNHMLIPRGTTQGYAAELFVMVSDYDEDRVDQDLGNNCSDSFSYCGIQDRKYPDKKAMGYPFDRLPRSGVTTLVGFLTSNMRVQDVTITFNDARVDRPAQKKSQPEDEGQ